MDFITLQNGPTVPLDALRLAVELEGQGYVFSLQGDTLRLTRADGRTPELSEAQQAEIRRWKPHLMAIIEYQAPAVLR